MDRLPGVDFPPTEEQWGRIEPEGARPWSTLSRPEQSVMRKMRTRGTPLGEWGLRVNRGITTGYNRAFIIDDAKRQVLVAEDPKSAEIIKPVLRGRDVRRYTAEWAGLWLIDTHNGYGDARAVDIDGYPAVKEHLDGFYPQLAKRQDKGRTPYNLRSCSYHEDFNGRKLFWMKMSPEGRFAYSDSEIYCNNLVFVMSGGPLKYLCAVLNSTLVTWMMQNTAVTTGMGLIEWVKFSVERIPIPRISDEEQRPFVEQVDRIVDAKATDPEADTDEWERAIDRLVYGLYGLTADEASAVERTLGLSGSANATVDEGTSGMSRSATSTAV